MISQAFLCQGINIALDYINFGTRKQMPAFSARAKAWAIRYFEGDRYARRGAENLLAQFPDLFNMEVEPCLRLYRPQLASSPSASHADDEAAGNEKFPEYAETLLTMPYDVTAAIATCPRRSPSHTAAKPLVPVDAPMLLASGLTAALPELLAQLAKADFAVKPALAQQKASAVSVGGGKKRKASGAHTDERPAKVPCAGKAAYDKSAPSGPAQPATAGPRRHILRLKRPSPTKAAAAAALPSPTPARPLPKIVLVGPYVRFASVSVAASTAPMAPPACPPADENHRRQPLCLRCGPLCGRLSRPAACSLGCPCPSTRKIEVVGKFAYAAAPRFCPALLTAAEPAPAPAPPRRIKLVGAYARPFHGTIPACGSTPGPGLVERKASLIPDVLDPRGRGGDSEISESPG